LLAPIGIAYGSTGLYYLASSPREPDFKNLNPKSSVVVAGYSYKIVPDYAN
jgi:hypothetical protein